MLEITGKYKTFCFRQNMKKVTISPIKLVLDLPHVFLMKLTLIFPLYDISQRSETIRLITEVLSK